MLRAGSRLERVMTADGGDRSGQRGQQHEEEAAGRGQGTGDGDTVMGTGDGDTVTGTQSRGHMVGSPHLEQCFRAASLLCAPQRSGTVCVFYQCWWFVMKAFPFTSY